MKHTDAAYPLFMTGRRNSMYSMDSAAVQSDDKGQQPTIDRLVVVLALRAACPAWSTRGAADACTE